MRRARAWAVNAAIAVAAAVLVMSEPGIDLEEQVGLLTLFALRGERPAPNGALVLSLDGVSKRWFANLPPRFADWPAPLRRCIDSAAIAAELRAQALAPVPPRELHACTIDRLAELGAAAIAFDVAFNSPTSADARLRRSLAAQASRVVVLQYVEATPEGIRLVPLSPALDTPSTAPFILPSTGTVVHQYWVHLQPVDDFDAPVATLPRAALAKAEPTLAWSADEARTVRARADAAPAYRYFNHYGRAGTVPTLPLAAIFTDDLVGADGQVLQWLLDDTAVFVGDADLRVATQRDRFATPFNAAGQVPGVELAATAYLNLRHDETLRALNHGVRGLLVAGFTVAATAVALHTLGWFGLVTLAGLTLAYGGLAWLAFDVYGLWLPVAVPLFVVAPLAFLLWLASRYVTVVGWLFALAPHRLAQMLLRDGSGPRYLGHREVCVLFTDLAGYTGFAERHSPLEVEAFLNGYFRDTTACIEAEGGLVAALAGDGIMAIWGAPEPIPDGPSRAARAALAIARQFERNYDERRRRGLDAIRLRIGLHHGVGRAAIVGSTALRTYTVVGEVVNVAQRVEQLGKRVQGGDEAAIVLATEAVTQRLPTVIGGVVLGDFVLEGTRRPVRILRLRDAGRLTERSSQEAIIEAVPS